MNNSNEERGAWSVFMIFLRLGLTSFGGPVAHLAYFHNEFVMRRKWVTQRAYADLVALCHFLPGPSSSQVGMALGLSRSGYGGALAAWAGFTLPSAVLMIFFAFGIVNYGNGMPPGVLQGLKVAAVAVVAQAVWAMARQFCTTISKAVLMVAVAGMVLLIPSAWAQLGVILIAACIGMLFFKPDLNPPVDVVRVTVSRRVGVVCLLLFVILLVGLPVLSMMFSSQALAVFDAFYRVGSLVFGGGHVVLPLLQAEVVPAGWVSNDTFLAGYGAAQAVPGPLFTFAAFLGASIEHMSSGWWGGLLCLVAIFLPSFLLVSGVYPFWDGLRHNRRIQAALSGVNAAVVGLLLAALYHPVWTSAVHKPWDVVGVVLALVALAVLKLPAWLVVICSAVIGGMFDFLY